MADVTITVDGKQLTAEAGELLIDVCRKAGIEIPAFCSYPGLSPQAACRMCLVRQEKVGKLQTACTTHVAEGQVFFTDTDEVHQARKAMLQLLLGNHPLDCPVCDAGGECELQDMTFKYGAGTSQYVEIKNHREEQQWSPAIFYDRPRCILCYRCVRVCGEGMDVWALGIQNRGSRAVIAPNKLLPDGSGQLDCEQCGNCIDICPVGALTSGTYRYKTRPWEMNHVSTVCTHCADGCRVTLGVRQTNEGAQILRSDNRDRGGINNDFLCAKGRFGFDFVHSEKRLTTPLVRSAEGKLEPATWEQALRAAAAKFKEIRDSRGGAALGVIGSNRTTNEENYLLQKFARTVLGTNNIDHARTADYAGFAAALAGHADRTASLEQIAKAQAILLVGGNPTEEHPLLAWTLRTAVRIHRARLYVANDKPIKLERQAALVQELPAEGYKDLAGFLSSESKFAKALAVEDSLVVILGPECTGEALRALVAWGLQRPGVRFACVGGRSNSRGAADMGIAPDLLPGFVPVTAPGAFAEYKNLPQEPGKSLDAMLDGDLGALLVVGANPAARADFDASKLAKTFFVVEDLFLTETAQLADIVLPAASLYEKNGTVTNTFGTLQRVKKAADLPGVKSDFEILVRLADAMGAEIGKLVPFGKGTTADLGQSRGAEAGEADRHAVWLAANRLEPKVSPFDPLATLDEIERLVPGYKLDRLNLFAGNAMETEAAPAEGFVPLSAIGNLSAHAGLFDSGTVGNFSKALGALGAHQKEVESK